MGFFYLGLLIVYLLISSLVVWLVKKFINRRWLTALTVAFVVLFPTYDILMQGVLLAYYGKTRPLLEIKRTVDVPGSVYWEDNVWPGYDVNYRLWMIDHLLDGTHLDTLAMNGEDGKIYLYRYGKGDTPEVFTKAADLPPLNYQVRLNPVPLGFWEKPFIWADRIEIVDQRTQARIAFSERYMGYSPRMIVVKVIGGEPFEGAWSAGDRFVYGFDKKVLFLNVNTDSAPELYRSLIARGSMMIRINNYMDKRKRGTK